MRLTALLPILFVVIGHSALAQSVLLTDTFGPEPDLIVARTSVVSLPQALPGITAGHYAAALKDLGSALGYTCSTQGEFMLWNDTAAKGLAFDDISSRSALIPVVLEQFGTLGYPATTYDVDVNKMRALDASGVVLQTSTKPIMGVVGESWYSLKDKQIFYAALYWCMTA